ncbi:MAG: MTAP family purine nucleoside phosphorylase [Deltaproteobacteria bacterium]|nr:MTAP family purine nucleoside phosphorylase [Deltaproteobacteria bacterium]MBW2594876.1 MTAP family purine nucleoside phosphorylase [Deltaproteobacteria bacterium]
MKPVGIISGTIPLHEEDIFKDLEKTVVENEFGSALVLLSGMVAFIPRHGMDAKSSIPPHMINHHANLKALQDMGVKEIIGINSTGSLKRALEPGTIIIPDDYISTSGTPTIFHNSAVHIIPVLDEGTRKRLIHAAKGLGINVVENGVYWQTPGPRLETRAEIRMMSQFADIIGMTMASEATIAVELGLSYAAICSVDNYAHGIVEKPLVPDEIRKGARKNARNMLEIIGRYVKE